MNMLSDRIMMSNTVQTQLQVFLIGRGDRVVSRPVLWTVLLDDLLNEVTDTGTKAEAFTDDLFIMDRDFGSAITVDALDYH